MFGETPEAVFSTVLKASSVRFRLCASKRADMKVKVNLNDVESEQERDLFEGLEKIPKCQCGKLAYIYTTEGCFCNDCSPKQLRKEVKKPKRIEPTRINDSDDYSFTVEIKHETKKAILINYNGQEYWLPKSQISWDVDAVKSGQKTKVVIPFWLAEKKEMFS